MKVAEQFRINDNRPEVEKKYVNHHFLLEVKGVYVSTPTVATVLKKVRDFVESRRWDRPTIRNRDFPRFPSPQLVSAIRRSPVFARPFCRCHQ